jgi:hypothetical protein
VGDRDRGRRDRFRQHPEPYVAGQPVTVQANRYDAGSGWGTPEPVRAAPADTRIQPGEDTQVAVNDDGVAFAIWAERGAWPDGAAALGLPNDTVFQNMWASRYVPGQGWGVAQQIGGPEHLNDGTARGTLQTGSFKVKVDAQGRALALWHHVSGRNVWPFPHTIWVNRFD